jgi:hypothetical protein
MRCVFGLLCWLGYSGLLLAQPAYDFEDDWIGYDGRRERYVPLVALGNSRPAELGLIIPLSSWHGYYLGILSRSNSSLFIENRLEKLLVAQQVVYLSIDSLEKTARKPSLFFTFHFDKEVGLPQVWISYKPYKRNLAGKNKLEERPMIRRPSAAFKNFAVFVALGLLLSYTFLRNVHPKTFVQYFSPTLWGNPNEKKLTVRNMTWIQLLFLLNHSLLLAFGLMLFAQVLPSIPSGLLDYFPKGNGQLYLQLLGLTLLIFVLILAKYALVFLSASLWGAEKVASVHFYQHISLSQVFYLILISGLFFLEISAPNKGETWVVPLFYLISGFQFIRSVFIAYQLNKMHSFHYIYLFSYLCVTEAVPVLWGIRYFNEVV